MRRRLVRAVARLALRHRADGQIKVAQDFLGGVGAECFGSGPIRACRGGALLIRVNARYIGRQKIVAIVIAKDLTRQLKDNLTAWRVLGGFNDLLHVAEHRAGKDRQLIPWLTWIIAGDAEAPRAGRFVVMHGAPGLDEKSPFGKQRAPPGWRQTTARIVGLEWHRRR